MNESDEHNEHNEGMISVGNPARFKWLWTLLLIVFCGLLSVDFDYHPTSFAWCVVAVLTVMLMTYWLPKVKAMELASIKRLRLSVALSSMVLCCLLAYVCVMAAHLLLPSQTVVRDGQSIGVYRGQQIAGIDTDYGYEVDVKIRSGGFARVRNFNSQVLSFRRGDRLVLYYKKNTLGTHVDQIMNMRTAEDVRMTHFFLQALWYQYRDSSSEKKQHGR
mgnify:CR=1 FL=1